jgi:DHA3 family tetracycline resistance protein-like MFS transporter
VYDISDSPTALAVVGAAVTLPNLALALFAGVLTDRFERRRVLLASDVLRGCSIGVTAWMALSGRLDLWHLVALSVLYGIGQVLAGPAFTALVPDLVPGEELAEANALNQVVRPLSMNLIGPAVGGFVIAAAGAGSALVFDAASFCVSIAALVSMRAHPVAPRSSTGLGIWGAFGEIKEGFGYVRAHTWLWATLAAACVSLLFFMGPVRVLMPFVVKNQLAGSASDLGLVLAAGGVGAILSSLIVGQRGLPGRPIVVMFVAFALAVCGIAAFGIVGALWQAAVVNFMVQGLATVGEIIWVTLLGTRVPRELLGRVSSLDWLLSIGLVPVSFIATGPIAEVLGVQRTLIAAGLIGGGIFLAFLFVPGMREVERLPEAEMVARF